MKNKIILGGLSLLLCVTCAACGNSASTMTKTNLSSQLDKTNNSIATVKSVAAADVELDEGKLDKIEDEKKCQNFKNSLMRAQDTLNAEEYYKNEILSKTALLKKYLQKEDLKLAKGELNALKDLTSNLSNYNDNVARSSNEFNSTYRNYNTMKKSATRNIDRVNAKLNKITCNSNTRCAYYMNILNTLQNMEDILGIDDYEISIDLGEDDQNTTDENVSTPKTLTKNIDTYRPSETNDTPLTDDNTPPRNTDTYAPFRRNIDTYRPYGYGMYGYNGYGMNLPNGYGMNGYGNFYNGVNSPYRYNSNSINRLAQPVSEMDEDEEKLISEPKVAENIENSRLKDTPKRAERRTEKRRPENRSVENNLTNSTKDLNNNVENLVESVSTETNHNLTENTKKVANNTKNLHNRMKKVNDNNATQDNINTVKKVTDDVMDNKNRPNHSDNIATNKTEEKIKSVSEKTPNNAQTENVNSIDDKMKDKNMTSAVKDLENITENAKTLNENVEDKIKSVSLTKVEEIDDNADRVRAQ